MESTEDIQQALSDSLQREKELQNRVDDLTDFIENASMPLHWVNGSGIILWANQVELDLVGYQKEEYIGKHISNFHADSEVIDDILFRLINKETLTNFPAQLRAKDGRIIPVKINSNVRWEGDTFVHTRCFTRDISDLKKMEEEKISMINELNELIRSLNTEIKALKQDSGIL